MQTRNDTQLHPFSSDATGDPKLVGISRRSVYSRRKPATVTDLALMRCIDALSKRREACHERYPASTRTGGF